MQIIWHGREKWLKKIFEEWKSEAESQINENTNMKTAKQMQKLMLQYRQAVN